ncbi:hypothetical protein VTN00DRAFT_5409 [Thermoascus crustaceus]|uniref:uncharacterized protein n=1 Tax=Thermoascus crustaceus TaxID=5088 RepID=UPI003741F807
MVENEDSSKEEEEEDEEDNTEEKREQLRKLIAFMRELKPEAFEDMPLRSSEPLKDRRVTELMMSNWNPMEPPSYDHLGLLPYEYVPLPSTTSIRVMKLLETENGLLHCTLKTIDILDRSESFEERGKAHSTETWPIICDGKLMLVPKNLFDCLHQLPRNAWARRLDRADKKGQTIVHKLAINGGMKVKIDDVDLNMAFRALAFVNQRDEIGSIFHALQAAGAHIQATDSKGKSALHHAAENGHIDAVKSLVALGLDATARDHEGKTAAEYAAGNGRQDIAEYLQQAIDTDVSYQACEKSSIHGLDRPDDWIWIDKICINQADMKELQSQIQIMDIIYSKAAFVKVWLGEEDPLTGPATELIQMIHGAPGRLRDSHIVPYRENTEQAYISADLPVVSFRQWLALGTLYRRQWFRRVWVFQEIVSANDVVMWCGRHEIPFAAFVEISRDILSRQLNYGIPCSTFLTPPKEAAHHLELDLCMMYKYASLRAQATILNSKRAREEFSMSRLVDVTRTLSFNATERQGIRNTRLDLLVHTGTPLAP